MTERKYSGASIMIIRMNSILAMAKKRGAVTLQIVAREFLCHERSAKKYLRRMAELGMVEITAKGPYSNSLRLYAAKPDAKPLPVPAPVHGPRRTRATGAKRGRPRLAYPMEKDTSVRKVVQVKAQQIGIARDPFTAAFFGTTQRQGA